VKGETVLRKILIANRGEIALRIIKTCQALGIETVAIYSDADASLPYVKEATTAVRIGDSPVQKSYLKSDAILAVAKAEGADAIHPGYGFLSENSTFAKAAAEQEIVFIGPSYEVIGLMGNKAAARGAMKKAGIPVVPGSEKGIATVEEACAAARSIGYPVMLKASGGGGGMGIQLCLDEEGLKKAYMPAKSRAKDYFGNDELFIEKYIVNARHIEVQVFGDTKGNVVHLFERDCSVQRRNQKVIEESPSPSLSEESRMKICQTAVEAARAVGYYNAGTVEFIVDEQEQFYFLEMNTRLQVEHPVTEEMTGIDLVKWQILVAQGQSLPLMQEEIFCRKHAVEFRVYAEDPVTFLPSPGTIHSMNLVEGDGIRIDRGYSSGTSVTPYYDPMIAKVIVSGASRTETLQTARNFFEHASIEGIKTNLPLFKRVLGEEEFQAGNYTTAYLSEVLIKHH
jgi:acetyl-CoA carboxylase biotin carboxylase subunit